MAKRDVDAMIDAMEASFAAPSAPEPVPRPPRRRRFAVALAGLWAAFLGALPHVLHHVGPLAGAAIFAGATGSLLFGALGFVAAIPFLHRLRRRTGSWRVPAAVLAGMAIAFTASTLIIGPAIRGDGDESAERPGPAGETEEHDSHH
jgi:hypothetical protein